MRDDDAIDQLLDELVRHLEDENVSPPDVPAIVAYVNGTASDVERAQVERALAQSVVFRRDMLDLMAAIEQSSDPAHSRLRASIIVPPDVMSIGEDESLLAAAMAASPSRRGTPPTLVAASVSESSSGPAERWQSRLKAWWRPGAVVIALASATALLVLIPPAFQWRPVSDWNTAERMFGSQFDAGAMRGSGSPDATPSDPRAAASRAFIDGIVSRGGRFVPVRDEYVSWPGREQRIELRRPSGLTSSVHLALPQNGPWQLWLLALPSGEMRFLEGTRPWRFKTDFGDDEELWVTATFPTDTSWSATLVRRVP